MLRERPLKMARWVPLKKAGRDFDIEFWQKLGASAILSAAWDLVVTAERMKNPNADLRLGVAAHFASKEDPIRAKRAAGRPSDKRDPKILLRKRRYEATKSKRVDISATNS
jgi:hypothetical protein